MMELTQFPRTAALVGLSTSAWGLLLIQGDAGQPFVSIFGSLVLLFIAYLVHRREMKKYRDQVDKDHQSDQHDTTESLLRYSTDREKRLETQAQNLREEERAFFQRQMELSRRRGHLLSRGYMAMELANDRLIEMLRQAKVEVPPEALTYTTRRLLLAELKSIEEEQEREANRANGIIE